jgi:hypothetical protein
VLKAIREALETYASGMGVPAAAVIREFKKLPEADKFRMLAAIKELEKKHQEWVANGGKAPAPPEPEAPREKSPGELKAAEMRAEYLRTGIHPLRRQSLIVDRNGRPIRMN